MPTLGVLEEKVRTLSRPYPTSLSAVHGHQRGNLLNNAPNPCSMKLHSSKAIYKDKYSYASNFKKFATADVVISFGFSIESVSVI